MAAISLRNSEVKVWMCVVVLLHLDVHVESEILNVIKALVVSPDTVVAVNEPVKHANCYIYLWIRRQL